MISNQKKCKNNVSRCSDILYHTFSAVVWFGVDPGGLLRFFGCSSVVTTLQQRDDTVRNRCTKRMCVL
jgi:hypothetical protein